MTNDTKHEIAQKLLQNAAFDGWGKEALEKAAEDCGYDKNRAYIEFPGGIAEATDYLADYFDKQMQEEFDRRDFSEMRIRDRIAEAVMIRLEIYDRHKEAIRKLTAYYALPHNSGRALRNISRTVSLMWYAAGDKSTDFNYYSKRFLLAGVYSSTLLYWLKDNSDGYRDTREFLNKRIENVMQIQKVKSGFKNFVQKIPLPH